MARLLVLVAMLNAAVAYGFMPQDDVAQWDSQCRGVNGLRAVVAKSASGSPVEDDVTVTLHWINGAKTPLPLPQAWYLKRPKLSGQGAGCEGVLVHLLSQDLAFLAIAFDGRPGGEHIAVALVDLKREKVVDYLPDLGEVSDSYRVQIAPGSLAFPIARRSRLAPSGGEENMYELRRVTASRGKLRSAWLK